MSIASAITAAQGRVANAYTAVSNKGGTLPATQNLTNLPTAITSIPSGADIITAVNNTGASISEGDKVWICKDTGNTTLFLRAFTYADQYSYTGFATTSGADGANITVSTIFPDELTITLSTTTDDAYLNVR